MLKPERKRRGDNLWIEPVDWSRGLSANCGQWCGIPLAGAGSPGSIIGT